MKHILTFIAALLLLQSAARCADADTKTLRVFIFAGQSNMVGSDSKVEDIKRFPPFCRIGCAAGKGDVFLQHRVRGQASLQRLGCVAACRRGCWAGTQFCPPRIGGNRGPRRHHQVRRWWHDAGSSRNAVGSG